MKSFRCFLSILCLGAMLLALPALLGAQTAPLSKRMGIRPAGPEAILVYCEGSITVNGKVADIGTPIPSGALVQTGPASVAEIAFNTKNVIRLDEKTSAVLDLDKLQRMVELKSGALSAVLHKLDKLNGGNFSVKTPLINAGVKGTDFYTRIEGADSFVCICNGTIELSGQDGNSLAKETANHHKGLLCSPDGTQVTVADPPSGFEVGHSDKTLESLAARIGETITWGVTEGE